MGPKTIVVLVSRGRRGGMARLDHRLAYRPRGSRGMNNGGGGIQVPDWLIACRTMVAGGGAGHHRLPLIVVPAPGMAATG